jgi:hypothetical protein
MLNPSTADATFDDPTIRRCKSFTASFGCSRMEVVNLFALRSTSPQALYEHQDPIGPRNDEVIKQAMKRADLIVAAWGNHGGYRGRDREVASLAGDWPLFCLRTSKEGHPGHPLYIAATTPLTPWSIR